MAANSQANENFSERVQREAQSKLIKAKALQMAKAELKRLGVTYPLYSAGCCTVELAHSIQAYSDKESNLFLHYLKELESQIPNISHSNPMGFADRRVLV